MASAIGHEKAAVINDVTFEPLPLIASERRLHVRAFHYWRARADGRAMPTLSDCADLGQSGFAEQMILIDLAKGDRPARIRSIGRELAVEMPGGKAPRTGLVAELLARLPTVAVQRSPIGFEAETPEGGPAGRCFRGILLPVADEAGAIAHVLGVMSWRQMVAGMPGRDVMAAVASIGSSPEARPVASPWSTPPVTRLQPAAASSADRFAAARTWRALAATDRARSRTNFHAAVGAAHDAVADLSDEERTERLRAVFGECDEASLIERALSQARLLAIGGHDLARRLDTAPGGLADFIDQCGVPPDDAATPPVSRFRLSPLDPELLTPAAGHDRDPHELPARRAAR